MIKVTRKGERSSITQAKYRLIELRFDALYNIYTVLYCCQIMPPG